jgi:hypothetical protein
LAEVDDSISMLPRQSALLRRGAIRFNHQAAPRLGGVAVAERAHTWRTRRGVTFPRNSVRRRLRARPRRCSAAGP